MEQEHEKQTDNSPKSRTEHLRPWQYRKGMSGNPNGRPVGSVSMKTYVKNKLLSMTDEEREEFLSGIDKKVIWEMAEDKAGQGVNVTGEVVSKIVSIDE